MAGIESLTFDLTDCTLREQSEGHRGWMNSAHVAHKLRYQQGPLDWPFDLTKPEAAAEFYRKQCGLRRGDAGDRGHDCRRAEALRGLFKYRAPVPGSLAMYYVGILGCRSRSAASRSTSRRWRRARLGPARPR